MAERNAHLLVQILLSAMTTVCVCVCDTNETEIFILNMDCLCIQISKDRSLAYAHFWRLFLFFSFLLLPLIRSSFLTVFGFVDATLTPSHPFVKQFKHFLCPLPSIILLFHYRRFFGGDLFVYVLNPSIYLI